MLHRKEYLRRRDEVKCVANFYQIIRILKSQFFTSFCSTFRALCHFCVNEFGKFIFSSWLAKRHRKKRRKTLNTRREKERRGKKQPREVKKKLGVGDKHPWMKWGSRKAFFFSPVFLLSKLPKLKLPFSPPWCARNFPYEKLKRKKSFPFSPHFVVFISIFPANESFSELYTFSLYCCHFGTGNVAC